MTTKSYNAIPKYSVNNAIFEFCLFYLEFLSNVASLLEPSVSCLMIRKLNMVLSLKQLTANYQSLHGDQESNHDKKKKLQYTMIDW